eukprot:symbB.v1.2.030199.t1/scaffold3379.1/size58058/4
MPLSSSSRSDSPLLVLDFSQSGASFFLRAYSQVGSTCSLLGNVKAGPSLLVLDFGSVGFSLTLRGMACAGTAPLAVDSSSSGLFALLHSFMRCASSMPIPNLAMFESSLLLRSFAHFGLSLSAFGQVHFTYTNTYIISESSTTNQLQVYVNNQRSLTLIQKPTGATTGNVGGALHGLWYADHMLHISDKRLKKSISSLADNLDGRGQGAGVVAGSGKGAAWILRQLRPVSYYFKRDVEAKHLRFGFIADEVASTLPEVVHQSSDGQKIKGIAYQDLIAVMVVNVQSLNTRAEEAEGVIEKVMARLIALEQHLRQLEDSCTRRANDLEVRLTKLELLKGQ